MADDFQATHQAKQDPPPRVRISFYNAARGHVTVASADITERTKDGRDGTLLQGQEKVPTAVYDGDAIVEYEGTHVCAVMRPGDVSAWFEPIPADPKVPKLPARSRAERVDDKETP